MKFKKPIAHLCYDLVNGKVVSIKTGFNDYGITNIPREISRAVERKFGIILHRTKKEEINKNGFYRTWHEYKLIKANQTEDALTKIYAYIQEWMIKPEPRKKGGSGFTQTEMFK